MDRTKFPLFLLRAASQMLPYYFPSKTNLNGNVANVSVQPSKSPTWVKPLQLSIDWFIGCNGGKETMDWYSDTERTESLLLWFYWKWFQWYCTARFSRQLMNFCSVDENYFGRHYARENDYSSSRSITFLPCFGVSLGICTTTVGNSRCGIITSTLNLFED
jgi:hypothetical protein